MHGIGDRDGDGVPDLLMGNFLFLLTSTGTIKSTINLGDFSAFG
jgi:hypothetical protein